jgi:hypothetical protein
MVESKVRLTILVQGAGMVSEQECSKDSEEVVKPAKKQKAKVQAIQLRPSKTAKQVISICKEAYEYMTSKEGRPTLPSVRGKYSNSTWCTKMGKKARLEAHLSLISQSLGGISFSYEILED